MIKRSDMKYIFLPFFSIYLCIILPLTSYPSDIPPELKNGREVQLQVKNRYTGDDLRGSAEMFLFSKRGEKRVRKLNRFVKEYNGKKKIIIRITYPMDIRLTAFLVWEEDGSDTQFLYLPAMKKTRRISTKDRDQSFVGSDFSLYDMGNVEIEDFTYTDTKTDFVDGRECYYYECIAAPNSDAPYGRVQTWTDKEYLIRIKTIIYDRKGKLYKQTRSTDIRLLQDIWTPFLIITENLQDGHKTEFRMSKVEYNVGVPDNLFSLSNLETHDDIELGAEAETKSSQ